MNDRARLRHAWLALATNLLLALMAACGGSSGSSDPVPTPAPFQSPEPVAILGYDEDAMEPFLSRDGALLFFNNSNDPAVQTDLHWAERIDAVTFRYRGRIAGANSDQLDGVATMSASGRFCFVSLRAYDETLASIFCGVWRDGRVFAPALQRAAAPGIPGRVVFDAELDVRGDTLIVAEGLFRGGTVPVAADIRQARRIGGAFRLSPADDALFAALNTEALEYGAGLSADALTLAFTRLEGRPPLGGTSIWLSVRRNRSDPFGDPVQVTAIDGFAEAPTFAPDGNALYYHKLDGERFSIWRVIR
jgi:hypothetical protein